MQNRLAKRVQAIKPSPTLAITAKAKTLQAKGVDVVGFGAGEPDFDTPRNIKDAAIRAIEAGKTKYTAVEGTPELKDAILAKLKRDNGLDYAREEVIVSNGGKHSLYNIAEALFEKGDEVIIPAPYWVSYPDQVILNDAEPVFIEATDRTGFRIEPEQLRKAVTPRTKALILNSPSNPTGAGYSKKQLEALAEICVKNDIFIISDEIYEKIVYDGFTHVSVASLSPEVKERTLLVNGASKVYSMTGWRMGFAAGPRDIIAAMSKIQGQSTSNICSITQAACVEAYAGPQDALVPMVAAFKERRDFIVRELNAMPGIACNTPEGAFYVFPNISKLLGKKTPKGRTIATSADFCDYLLDEHLVAAVSGEGFGAEGYMRLSYATSLDNIKKGLFRIKCAVTALG
jgi:aspartate aminotransferase